MRIGKIEFPDYINPKVIEWLREHNLLPDGAETSADPVAVLSALADTVKHGGNYEILEFDGAPAFQDEPSYWLVIHVWNPGEFDLVAVIGAQNEFVAWAWD